MTISAARCSRSRATAIAESLGPARGGRTRTIPPCPRPAATFVTLTQHGELRGCIGTLEAFRPLAPRRARERGWRRHFATRASCRSPPESSRQRRSRCRCCRPARSLDVADEDDLLAAAAPGIDGLTLEYGRHRATFLPQVWDQLADPREFLGALKRKAGLPADFWQPADPLLPLRGDEMGRDATRSSPGRGA